MSPGIAALKQAGVKAVVLSTNPRQTASAVAAAAQLGLAVPIIINNPGFAPELLQGPLTTVMERQVLVLSSVAPFDAAIAGPRQVAAAYRSTFPQGVPSMAVNYGYLVGLSFGSVLSGPASARTSPAKASSRHSARSKAWNREVCPHR